MSSRVVGASQSLPPVHQTLLPQDEDMLCQKRSSCLRSVMKINFVHFCNTNCMTSYEHRWRNRGEKGARASPKIENEQSCPPKIENEQSCPPKFDIKLFINMCRYTSLIRRMIATRQQRNRQHFLRPMIPMVPDVCIRFDDNRTTMDMINRTCSGKSTYEYKLNGDEMSDVDKH